MTTIASVVLFKNAFIATLSDGRRIETTDLGELAISLAKAGAHACDVTFEWNGSAGQRMITAGQQVAYVPNCVARNAFTPRDWQPPPELRYQ
jgi:citrate lyase alpha subunit